MNFKLIRYFSVLFFVVLSFSVSAQDDYRAEIGVNGGLSLYSGDANSTIANNTQLAYGLIYRQKVNPRIAFHLNWNKTTASGSYNDINGTNVSFSNPVNMIDLCGEFNFRDLENKIYKPDSRTHAVFIFAGIGSMLYPYSGNQQVSLSIPFGLGYKIMLGKLFNLNIFWTNRLLLADNIEGIPALNNPGNLNGTNFLNNDFISTLNVGITLNIFKKRCSCLDNKY